MKMTDTLEKAFCDQITLEFQASIFYRQLAIEMDVLSFPGMATWLRAQADEELVHANKFIDHLVDRDNHPTINNVPASQPQVTNALDAFKAALGHEQKVSESIRNLTRTAEAEGDLDSRQLLNFFLNEQVEEEATARDIIDRLTLIKDDGPGLLQLDTELGARASAGTENTGA